MKSFLKSIVSVFLKILEFVLKIIIMPFELIGSLVLSAIDLFAIALVVLCCYMFLNINYENITIENALYIVPLLIFICVITIIAIIKMLQSNSDN